MTFSDHDRVATGSSSIGLSAIWGEGRTIEKVSPLAVVSHCVRQAYENVRRSVVTSVLTLVTIAVAIFLLGVFFLLMHNASRTVANERGEIVVMLFLKDAPSAAEVQTLTQQVQEIARGHRVTFIDKGQALQYFRGALGEDASMLDGLDANNPLPASLQVQLSSPDEAERLYEAISERFATSAQVESIRYSRGGVQQIKRMLRLIKVVGSFGMAFLFVIAGFIIANTIKLALFNHRAEIEIMQLVGARRAAICIPYLLEGFVQGVFGAALGLLGVAGVFLLVRSALHRTEVLQMLFPSFSYIPAPYVLAVLVCGALVGVVSSFLAVRRFLADS